MSTTHTPCLVVFTDGLKLVSSVETIAKYRALYGEPTTFKVSALPKEGSK